jgi:hypothetical protein
VVFPVDLVVVTVAEQVRVVQVFPVSEPALGADLLHQNAAVAPSIPTMKSSLK